MFSLSPDCKSLARRLIIAGIFVLSGFYAGCTIFSSNIFKNNQKIEVKNSMAVINEAIQKDIQLTIEGKTIILKSEELKNFVEPYTRSYSNKKDYRFSNEKMSAYLNSLALSVNREPVNAKFQFKDNRAEIFTPSSSGKKLDIDKSMAAIKNGVLNKNSIVALVVESIEPEVTLEKINSLGIETLLAIGESNFAGSSSLRILNIKISSAKYNGLILKPGEELSFNQVLGSVEEKDGYTYEKVIKNHKIVYDLGGGICQVSTTLFRAAILAGFPILERHNHAFPVQYYNPQGFDATIYPGTADLKFVNNTAGYMIVQTKIEGTKLMFEIYGSSDGRKVEMTGPIQYDQQSNGAMKAYFTRKITYADGTTKEERFDSNYKSPLLYPLEKNPLE